MNGYLWKKEWCWPYESAWSILEKFKYANAITNDTLRSVISLRTSTSTMIFTEDLYIYRQSKFAEEEFFRFFQIDPNHFDSLKIFRGNDYNRLFRKELYYCPTCIQVGYHSFLHQPTFVSECPFHKEPLIAASYDGKAIPYSIHTKKNEAYSTMADQAKISARQYVDVMESRKLIDGIWESVPTIFHSISITNCCGIRYFNPSVDSSRTAMVSDDRLQSSLKSLFFDKYPSIKPVASFFNEECITLYNELIHRIEDICLSLGWDFDKGSLDEWLIQITVEDLLSDIAPDLLKKVISSINFLEESNNIEAGFFHKVAAQIITAYIITDSTYLSEAFDYSLISRFYNHKNRNSIFTLRTMLSGKDFNTYILISITIFFIH